MKKTEYFKLTDQSLTKLKKEGLPEEILAKLKDLKEQELPQKKFLHTIENTLKDQTAQYLSPILKHAEIAKYQGKSALREYAEALIIAIILALFIRTFIVEAFKIPSGSMEPTLLVGDHLLVSKFTYKFTEPQRGDIIVFKYPDDPSRNFIKRIIGVGGDTIEIRDKAVYVNGVSQTEPYVQHTSKEILPAKYSPRDNFGPLPVPPGSYFMMGDNRDSSLDSRFWQHQFVNRRTIVGKALIIYWSWEHDEENPGNSQKTFLNQALDYVKTVFEYMTHFPSVVRWKRLGRIIK